MRRPLLETIQQSNGHVDVLEPADTLQEELDTARAQVEQMMEALKQETAARKMLEARLHLTQMKALKFAERWDLEVDRVAELEQRLEV
jgi:hypothetical protein